MATAIALAASVEILRDLDEEEDAATDANADLVLAAYFGDAQGVKKALDRGASPDARQTGTGLHALWLAVSNDHVAIVRMLIERGADATATVTAQDGMQKLSFTALDRAEAEGKYEIVELLRGARAPKKPKKPAKKKTAKKKTAKKKTVKKKKR